MCDMDLNMYLFINSYHPWEHIGIVWCFWKILRQNPRAGGAGPGIGIFKILPTGSTSPSDQEPWLSNLPLSQEFTVAAHLLISPPSLKDYKSPQSYQ